MTKVSARFLAFAHLYFINFLAMKERLEIYQKAIDEMIVLQEQQKELNHKAKIICAVSETVFFAGVLFLIVVIACGF